MNHQTTLSILAALLLLGSCNTPADQGTMANAPVVPTIAVPPLPERIAEYGDPTEYDALLDNYDKARLRIAKTPADHASWIRLAEVFITDARITGRETEGHTQAIALLDHVLSMAPPKAMQEQALGLKATVLLSQHRFSDALELGRKAVFLDPYKAFNYGLLVDAYTELGQYDSAVANCDRMVRIRPDLRSYSRVSYQREIHGDIPGAIEAMQMAVTAGVPGVEETEWCRVQLGGLHERQGDLRKAGEQYRLSMQYRKNYPFAMAAMARLNGKQKKYVEAERLLEQAIELRAEPAFFEEIARVYGAQGKDTDRLMALERAEALLTGGTGHDHGAGADHGHSLELARFELEFHNDPVEALHQLEGEFARRPDNIEVRSAMAAALLMDGEPTKALPHGQASMRTGCKDPLMQCIAGTAAVRNGEIRAGKALIAAAWKTDPYLQHPIALVAKAL